MSYATIFILLLMFAIPCAAQNEQRETKAQVNPDLSGTWVLVERRSNPMFRPKTISSTITIVQSGGEIRITTRFNVDGQDAVTEVVLYMDGREQRRYGQKGQVYVTRTVWDAGTLVTTHKSAYTSTGYRTRYEETVYKWTLSKDNKTLTRRTISMDWPNNSDASLYREVYTRLP